jgi:superfamily II DNA or RNA helicase
MASKILTLAQGPVKARVVTDDSRIHAHIQQLLSYTVDGFEHMAGVGNWSGRSSFFDFSDMTFPAGFVLRVYRELTRLGFKVNVVRKPLPAPQGPKSPKVDSFAPDPRYDYQDQVVDLLERYGQIIARVATGGGKSRIAKLAVARLARPTLFLTTRGILMHQMRDAFEADLKLPVGIYGDGYDTPSPKMMNVGMVQTFSAWLAQPDHRDPPEKQLEQTNRRRRALGLLEKFEFVILEEAHEASSDSYYDVLRMCRNAHYRLALTATPFMKDSEKANLQLEACSGPVAITVSEKTLIERGILARPYFKFVHIPEPYPVCEFVTDKGEVKTTKLHRSTPYQRAYELGVVGNVRRNQAIVTEVARAKSFGLTAMVLVQHKAHGTRLSRMLDAAGVRTAWIEGDDNQAARQAAIQALKRGEIDCLVGSTILDVGVDIPAVGLVVLAGAGKAEVAIRQRIGRGLRAKKDGPNVCFIVDFVDPVNNHLRSHSQERRRLIDTTPGFAEGVVQDFDYEGIFGVTRSPICA